MLDYENKEFYKLLISVYSEKQAIVAIEELSELIKEITKMLRHEGSKERLCEEIADCYIMLTQLIIMYDIQEQDLKKVVQEKVARTAYRLGTVFNG